MIEITPEFLRAHPLPVLPTESDKDARGQVLVVAGGPQVPGAALLSGLGALRAGAGKLQIAATAGYAFPLGIAAPEARVLTVAALPSGEIAPEAADDLKDCAGRCDAMIVGPGMMNEAAAGDLTVRLAALETGATFVIDAAALTGLRRAQDLASVGGRLVFTPHAGEMAGLLGWDKARISADPVEAARVAAGRWNAVVVMKGVVTHVVSPAGLVWRHDGGSRGLGTSGSGDVLAGVIGGLLARGAAPATAAAWGVWLHGEAGARLENSVGPLGFLAREILAEIPAAMARVSLGAAAP